MLKSANVLHKNEKKFWENCYIITKDMCNIHISKTNVLQNFFDCTDSNGANGNSGSQSG